MEGGRRGRDENEETEVRGRNIRNKREAEEVQDDESLGAAWVGETSSSHPDTPTREAQTESRTWGWRESRVGRIPTTPTNNEQREKQAILGRAKRLQKEYEWGGLAPG